MTKHCANPLSNFNSFSSTLYIVKILIPILFNPFDCISLFLSSRPPKGRTAGEVFTGRRSANSQLLSMCQFRKYGRLIRHCRNKRVCTVGSGRPPKAPSRVLSLGRECYVLGTVLPSGWHSLCSCSKVSGLDGLLRQWIN